VCKNVVKSTSTTIEVIVSTNSQSFDHFAANYDRRDELTQGFITQWLEGVLSGRGGASAIDLGCGTGRVAAKLADHYEHVLGIDLSQQMIDIARAKHKDPRITFERADLTTVTGQYDLVISLMALHHVPDISAALSHISGLVAPGGLAVLVDAANPPLGSRWKYYYWTFRGLLGDILHAFEKFWLSIEPSWVRHLLSDRFLSPEDFVSTYSSAFPGATLRPVSRLYTVVWQRPDGREEHAAARDKEGANSPT
jgi:ubiquinone/menaquinone biosynthesis C-methylase UbiE